MISLSDAQARIAADIKVLPAGLERLADCRGLVLAEPVVSHEAIPPFANTAMDGFALRSTDSEGASEACPAQLRVVGTVAAGQVAPRPLRSGEAYRIMTGAPLPDGADGVIMVELTRVSMSDSAVEKVELLAEVGPGNHVRSAGDDVEAGDTVFAAGEVLSPAHLGVLASLGVEQARVFGRPRVGVFSTGDELIVGSSALEPGQIRDSNRPALLALLAEAGFTPIDLGLLPDDEKVITRSLKQAVESCDALVTSGGVSMGDFDFVKQILSSLGDLNWMQVAIKPAKPLSFGLISGVPIFGLPGNPVSSMVSFELFARPALRRMMGRPDRDRPTVWALAEDALPRRADGKIHFHRVVVSAQADGAWRARSAGGQGSHQLAAMAAANGLAVLPDGEGIVKGGRVRVLCLGSVV